MCQSLSFNKVSGLTLAQVFSCEFCKISKNTFLTEHLWTTASGLRGQKKLLRFQCSISLGNVLSIQKGKIKESKLSIHKALFTYMFKGFFFLVFYLYSTSFKSGKFFLLYLLKTLNLL